MKQDMPPRRRVSEAAPVQVYLGSAEQRRLERLAAQLDATKSEVLRRGIEALEREVLDPKRHPALRLIGLAPAELKGRPARDAAREHDAILVETEEASWTGPPARKRKGTRRGR